MFKIIDIMILTKQKTSYISFFYGKSISSTGKNYMYYFFGFT